MKIVLGHAREQRWTIHNSIIGMFLKSLLHKDFSAITATEKKIWKVVDCLFTTVFLSEYVVRFAVAEALENNAMRLQFVFTPLNMCDVVSCIPFLVELVAYVANKRWMLR